MIPTVFRYKCQELKHFKSISGIKTYTQKKGFNQKNCEK